MASIRTATASDAETVGRVLAEGFGEDPVLGWVFEQPERAAKLHAFFGFLAHHALVPLGATFVGDGACAAWTPPDAAPWPEERGTRFEAVLAEHCTPGDLERLQALDAAQAAFHPSEPHWYLGVTAVEPEHQGRGLGSAVLTHSLEVVDAARLPAYLESTNPRNVSFYERHGFAVIRAIPVSGGPDLTAMRRAAR